MSSLVFEWLSSKSCTQNSGHMVGEVLCVGVSSMPCFGGLGTPSPGRRALLCLFGKDFFFQLTCLFVSLFIYFWLHWVFIAVHGLSLVAVSWGYSSLRCAGFSSWWLLLLQSMCSRCAGFSSCGAWAQQLWRTGSKAQAQQLWRVGPRECGLQQL